MWRAAGLEEPGGERKAKGRLGQSSGEPEGGEQVDNLHAGGFFGQYGREQHGLRPTVIPRYVPPAASPVPASPDEVPEAANEPEAMPDDQSDSSDI